MLTRLLPLIALASATLLMGPRVSVAGTSVVVATWWAASSEQRVSKESFNVLYEDSSAWRRGDEKFDYQSVYKCPFSYSKLASAAKNAKKSCPLPKVSVDGTGSRMVIRVACGSDKRAFKRVYRYDLNVRDDFFGLIRTGQACGYRKTDVELLVRAASKAASSGSKRTAHLVPKFRDYFEDMAVWAYEESRLAGERSRAAQRLLLPTSVDIKSGRSDSCRSFMQSTKAVQALYSSYRREKVAHVTGERADFRALNQEIGVLRMKAEMVCKGKPSGQLPQSYAAWQRSIESVAPTPLKSPTARRPPGSANPLEIADKAVRGVVLGMAGLTAKSMTDPKLNRARAEALRNALINDPSRWDGSVVRLEDWSDVVLGTGIKASHRCGGSGYVFTISKNGRTYTAHSGQADSVAALAQKVCRAP